jgi:hypothetical protein
VSTNGLWQTRATQLTTMHVPWWYARITLVLSAPSTCGMRADEHLRRIEGVHTRPNLSVRLRLAKVKLSFGEPIDARTIAPDETDEEVVYEKVTAVLKQRIQQLLDEVRRGN